MYQIGWFSTARGKGSQALLRAAQESIERGGTDAEVAFVFLSRDPGEAAETDNFIEQVKGYKIPLIPFSYQKFKAAKTTTDESAAQGLPQWRLDYDRKVMARLKEFHPDLCVLAGYMLIVGKEMCSKYNMINLHPAAPGGPTGTWREVIWQLIDERASETGVMMHLVTPELDKGPVVTYCTFPIRGEPFDRHWQAIEGKSAVEIKATKDEDSPLFRLIRRHGMARELPLIIATLKAFSQGRARIDKARVVDRQGVPVDGHDLSVEIDKMVKSELSND